MRLRYYVPISVGVFALVVGTAHYFSVPVGPFAVILLAGETLLGFQLEDHKVPKVFRQLLTPPKPHAH